MEITKIDIKKGADNVKGFVKGANATALKTSDKLVDNTLVAAEQWQEVAEKALKTGTILLEKQTDLMFTVLEGLKKQGMMGTARVKNLFSLEVSDKVKTSALRKKEAKEVAKITKKTIANVEAKVNKVEQKAKTSIAKAINKSADKVDKTVAKVEKATAKNAATAKATIKKEMVNVEKKAAAIAKAVKNAPAKATKKATTKKVTPAFATKKAVTKKTVTKTTIVTPEDLTNINGVGPKMKSVLNELGILTFADLAKADAKKLQVDLVAINPRYKMFETADWVKEAATKA